MMFGHLSKLVDLIGASESQLHMFEFTSTFCVLAISPNDMRYSCSCLLYFFIPFDVLFLVTRS